MKNNVTYSPKSNEVEKKWYIVDAKDRPVGKTATIVASILRGKHKPEFSYNVDCGDNVIVINCSEAIFTGAKLEQKMYRRHSGYMGGMKETSAKVMMETKPEQVMYLAVKGMLPHNKLGRKQLKKLRVYADDKHENIAQKPEVWEVTNG